MLGERFWSKVNKTDSCWVWTAFLNPCGYGVFRTDGGRRAPTRLAHRLAFVELVGPIPDGHEMDHTCRNRACVNPAHLEAVPHVENIRRSWNAREKVTHCPQGHEYAMHGRRNRRGYWVCRICHRLQVKRYEQRISQEVE